MKTRLNKVKVTQEIIDKSIEGDSHRCMVVEAVKAALPDARRVQVDTQIIRYNIEGERVGYLTPKKVQEAILMFDYGMKPKPFGFTLRDPDFVQKIEKAPAGEPKVTNTNPRGVTEGSNNVNEGGASSVLVEGPLPPTSKAARSSQRRFGLRQMLAVQLEAEAEKADAQ